LQSAALKSEMQLSLNPNLATRVYQLGEERSPLLVIDHFLQDAALLVEHACQQHFVQLSPLYLGYGL